MKALYRISIFCNVIAMAFIIIRGSELLTREWVQQNAAQSEILPEADAQEQAQSAVDMQMPGAEDTHKKTAEHVSSDTGETTTCDTILPAGLSARLFCVGILFLTKEYALSTEGIEKGISKRRRTASQSNIIPFSVIC